MSVRPLIAAAVLAPALLAAAITGGAADDVQDAPVYPDRKNLLVLRDAAGAERPIRETADWEKRRAHVLLNMQKVMGLLPKRQGAQGRLFRRPVPLDLQVESEEPREKYVRKKVSYVSVPEERVPAYLFIPKRLKGKAPAVLCLHQTVKLGKDEPAGMGSRNLAYAHELAERGYVVLAPDYPGFGENGVDPYERGWDSGSMKAIWDNIRGVDVLQSLPEVDGRRIGCLGHSLGGHNTMFTGAFDTRIQAMVSNCGFTAFGKYYGGNLTGWTGRAYMPHIKELFPTPEKMPFDFHEVVASFAPRAFLAIAPVHDSNFEVSGVQEVIEAARPVYRLYGKPQHLAVVYPDYAHDWPLDTRILAYNWLDRWLKKEKPTETTAGHK